MKYFALSKWKSNTDSYAESNAESHEESYAESYADSYAEFYAESYAEPCVVSYAYISSESSLGANFCVNKSLYKVQLEVVCKPNPNLWNAFWLLIVVIFCNVSSKNTISFKGYVKQW